MWNLTAFFAMFAAGRRGYPFAAFTRLPDSYHLRAKKTPVQKVWVTMDTPSGAQILTYSQAEFAARFHS